eukprot:m.151035 g.151035  ORF g.151035 m.151035 type:complete len:304 (-) comp15033_c0_seq8:2214-3125(-)
MTSTYNTQHEYLIKAVVIGDVGCGKSALVRRYCEDVFSTSYEATIGIDFKIRSIDIDFNGVVTVVKLQIWDTAGQERFRSITKCFYRGAHLMCYVYDMTSSESFDHLENWVHECLQVWSQPETVAVLIGNKSDLHQERTVSRAAGKAFAQRYGMLFAETSAQNATNVQEVFSQATAMFLHRIHYDPSISGKQPKSKTCGPVPRDNFDDISVSTLASNNSSRAVSPTQRGCLSSLFRNMFPSSPPRPAKQSKLEKNIKPQEIDNSKSTITPPNEPATHTVKDLHYQIPALSLSQHKLHGKLIMI